MKDLERMQCMEIRGGNEPVDLGVSTPGLDVRVLGRPYAKAAGGGDLHMLSSCASGRITRFVIADVSGHGDAVSRAARFVRDLMRSHINHVDQTEFTAAMNRGFAGKEVDSHFATALVGTYFAVSRKLTFTTAGHPAPLVRRAGETQWSSLGTVATEGMSNIPLGVLSDTNYVERSLRLDRGDQVLIYTDGAVETAPPGRPADQIGVEGLCRLLDEADAPTDEMLPRLERDLEAIAQEPADDLTFMLLTANEMSVSMGNTLMAPVRVIADLFGLRHGADRISTASRDVMPPKPDRPAAATPE